MRRITSHMFIGWILSTLLLPGRAQSTAGLPSLVVTPELPPPGLRVIEENGVKGLSLASSATEARWQGFDAGDAQAQVSSAMDDAATSITVDTTSTIEWVGHIGGHTEALFVQGHYAYVGVGPALVVLDISDPIHPVEIGRVVGGWQRFVDIYVAGDYAYIAGYNLWVVNVSNPAAPTQIGFCETPGSTSEIAGTGNYLYVADEYGGLRVIDVSDPANPVEVGFRDISEDADLVVVSNDPQTGQVYAYVADDYDDGGLWVIDVSDPTTPILAGFYDSQGDYVTSLAVAGDYVFVVPCESAGYFGAFTTCELEILGVSNPAAPAKVGTYRGMNEISIVGGYAYGHSGGGLLVVDISDPTAPTEVGFCEYDFSLTGGGIAVANGYVFISDLFVGLRVVDVSDPSEPIVVSFYSNAPILADNIAVGNNFAYVSEQQSHYLWSINISNPVAPVRVDRYILPSRATAITVMDNLAYITDGGFLILDVSNPAAPVAVGFSETPLAASDVAVRGNFAYVAARDEGLRIMDVSDPTAPVQVGFLDGWFADSLTVASTGNYIYVTGMGCGVGSCMRVIDVSDAVAPVQAGSVDIAPATDVAVEGDPSTGPGPVYVYVVGNEGLQIIDVSSPTAPAQLGFFEAPHTFESVVVADGYAYVAGIGGLWVIDVSDPLAPVRAGFYDGPSTDDIAVMDDHIYATAGGDGLLVFRFIKPTVAISGRVTHANGMPFPGVTVSASGGLTTVTDADGAYAFTHLITGTFTLTPTLDGYTFWPPTRIVTVPPDASGQDFTVLAASVSTTLSLSGTLSLPASLVCTDTLDLVTRLDFPAGAVSRPTEIVLRPILATGGPGWAFAGHAFELTAYQAGSAQLGFRFNHPVTVTIHYSDVDVQVVSEEERLALLRWAGDAWQDAARTCDPSFTYTRDIENNVLSVPICSLSRFGLFGPTYPVYLPFVVRNGP